MLGSRRVPFRGYEHATPEELAVIEIDPSGFGLRWPLLDADHYLPGLLQGVFGSRAWMAAKLGAEGGKAASAKKAAAARKNGKLGGPSEESTGCRLNRS